MIDNKKVSSYLLYAVGEVFLVVVGILIAVQIDNWNEQRKVDKQAENLLLQIQDEALLAIRDINGALQSYKVRDSLYAVVLSDTLTAEDYQKPENQRLIRLIFQWSPFSYQKEGYTSFMEQIEQFSPKYQALSKQIKETYLTREVLIGRQEVFIEEMVRKNLAFAQSQSWLISIFNSENGQLNPVFVEYLTSDSRYKNDAFYYAISISDHSRLMWAFQSLLVDLYITINEVIETPLEVPPLIKDYSAELSETEIAQLVGTYHYNNDSLIISTENNRLFMDNAPLKALQGGRLLRVSDSYRGTPIIYNLAEGKLDYKPLYRTRRTYCKQ